LSFLVHVFFLIIQHGLITQHVLHIHLIFVSMLARAFTRDLSWCILT